MKIKNEKVIEYFDFDTLVSETYGRPYKFQQQQGCRDRGVWKFTAPELVDDDLWPDSVPEIVNHEKMGVNFAAWLARDPKQPLPNQDADYQLRLWWERNFYPPFWDVVNDLHAKGLIEAGDYTININW